MGSLLVVAIVSVVVFGWLRGVRRSRARWLQRLDLPGSWAWEGHQGKLVLSGDLSAGVYRLTEPGTEEQGQWLLHGHSLELTPKGSPVRIYDLRFFDTGKIGLALNGRDARIYHKIPSNVVQLRTRNG